MARRKAEKRPTAPTNFKVGDKVRVRHGVADVEYPDMPLGGWAGTIHEIHNDGMYTVRWSGETLAAIHPVFKKRCERDGMVLEEYWLGDDDLEPDDGGPLDIEHPKEIATKPLSPKDQDDRVRMVFELTSNDPLPDVDDETLETYYKYLSKNLAFSRKNRRGGGGGCLPGADAWDQWQRLPQRQKKHCLSKKPGGVSSGLIELTFQDR